MSFAAAPAHRGPQHQQKPIGNGQAKTDAETLLAALQKKWFQSTDDAGVFRVLCHRTVRQIQEVRTAYLTEIKRDLEKDVKDNTSGNFEDLIRGLVLTNGEFDAYQIHKAVKGLGTDEDALIEILSHREPHEVVEFNEAYQKTHGKSAFQAIQDDVSGELGQLFSLLSNPTNKRQEPPNAAAQIEVDVRALYEASQGKMVGHDAKPFIQILGGYPKSYIQKVYTAYVNKHGKTLEKIIEKWPFDTVIERALLAIVTPAPEYYSNLLHKAMKGLGTNDKQLIRILVSQRERYLPEVADHFLHTHKKALKEAVKSETSGDYQSALIALLEFYAEAK